LAAADIQNPKMLAGQSAEKINKNLCRFAQRFRSGFVEFIVVLTRIPQMS
jgi:hypothetical protein